MNEIVKKLNIIVLILVIDLLVFGFNISYAAIENSTETASYIVLGRKLTDKEGVLYKNLNEEEKVQAIKNDILSREQNLVAVRSLLAVGEADNINLVISYLHFSDTTTFNDLVGEFTGLKEKYGSVKKGLEIENKYRLSDEEIFEQTSLKAYETVFCVSDKDLESDKKRQLFSYFKARGITKYTEMIQSLMSSMDSNDKKNLLFKVLGEIGRDDLRKDEKFINKMLEQDFTCENLRILFEKLKK